jgi:hypothetical protein
LENTELQNQVEPVVPGPKNESQEQVVEQSGVINNNPGSESIAANVQTANTEKSVPVIDKSKDGLEQVMPKAKNETEESVVKDLFTKQEECRRKDRDAAADYSQLQDYLQVKKKLFLQLSQKN